MTNHFFRTAILTLFVTTFSLFLGWVPIGTMIPQAIFMVAALFMCSKAFMSKPMILLYLFFVYQYFSGLFYGSSDIVAWISNLFSMAIPVLISSILFSQSSSKYYKGFSQYALIASFITVLLSIRVLISDGSALRVTSMANSTGDWVTLYGYWRQGMADYGMAAMMAFMPVVLIYYYKNTVKRKEKTLLLVGIALIIVFMYLGQVTTTFVLCILLTLLSIVSSKNTHFTNIGFALIAVFLLTQLSGLLDFAIMHIGDDSQMTDRFTSMASALSGEELEDTSDAGTRMILFNRTIRAFISNPIFGNLSATWGGHNYFLDCLAKYGVIGCLPFFMLLKNQFTLISSRLSPKSQQYYLIIFISFIVLGLIKNMSGTEYWNYLFIYYPAILVWIDSRTQPSRIKLPL